MVCLFSEKGKRTTMLYKQSKPCFFWYAARLLVVCGPLVVCGAGVFFPLPVLSQHYQQPRQTLSSPAQAPIQHIPPQVKQDQISLSPKQGWTDLEKANIPEQASFSKRALLWPVNRVRDVFDIGIECVDAVLGIFGVDIQGDDLTP